MRRPLSIAIAASAMALCCLAGGGPAAASGAADLTPLELAVQDGPSWTASPSFRLAWRRSGVGPGSPTPTTIDFVVRDLAGNVVLPQTRLPWRTDTLEPLTIPRVPGIYVAEVWLEALPSLEGPHATTLLRFDDARPGQPQAVAAAPWFGSGAEPSLRIEGTQGSIPVSGLRGYAVSVDRDGPSSPCAAADRCGSDEIDLPAADAPDTLALGAMPEGVNVVRVASVSGSGVPSAASTKVDVRVDLTPPAVGLDGVPAGWARGPVRLTASAHDQLSGMAPAGGAGPFTAIAVDGGAAALAQGGSVATTVRGDGAHLVAYYARDAAGNTIPGAQAPSAATAVVRIDESPPQVSFARSQDPAEPERIEARVSDRLSGPDPARGSIALRPSGSSAPFRQLPTAVAGDRLTAVWDSDAFPPGSYEFRATGYDLAGNPATTDRRDDGARMVLANPLKQVTGLRLGFAAQATSSSIYGRRASVAGRLATASGAPLPGLPVEIVESFDGGATTAVRTRVVQTGAGGRFRARLSPGPSRRVEAFFAGTRTLSRSSGRQLRLGVPASVRLRTSSARARVGGRPVVFSGRVDHLGASLPAGGRPVELQFRVPGMPWSEFRTVQTDARGHFRYAYAFADDDSRGVRFQFRAVAAAEDGWPYETAASRPVIVTGT